MNFSGEKMKKGEHAVYLRMATGGIIGLVLSGVLGYAWAAYKNNLNPVAGLGLVVLCSLGLVAGAVIGLFKKRNSGKASIHEHRKKI
jgi:hypothetical protein